MTHMARPTISSPGRGPPRQLDDAPARVVARHAGGPTALWACRRNPALAARMRLRRSLHLPAGAERGRVTAAVPRLRRRTSLSVEAASEALAAGLKRVQAAKDIEQRRNATSKPIRNRAARRPMMIGDESLGYEVPLTW